jgi:hypothetical protein
MGALRLIGCWPLCTVDPGDRLSSSSLLNSPPIDTDIRGEDACIGNRGGIGDIMLGSIASRRLPHQVAE